jgi:peptidoglycan-associated lipoprotein
VLLFPAFLFAGGGMREADHAFASQEYYNAMQDYQNVIGNKNASKTDVARANFQIGECYKMLSKWKDAKKYYLKAISLKYPDDKARLYLAQTEQMLSEYADAINDYTIYKGLVPSDPSAQIGIDACNDALSWMNIPDNKWKIKNEEELNSKTNDFCPTFSDRKHSSIVFSSKRPGQTGSNVDPISGGMYSDLFEAKKSNTGKWSTPTTVQGNVNLPTSNDGASCITKNGTHIFFTRCDQQKKQLITCKIYYSEKKGNSWDVPVLVDFGLDAATLDSFNFRHPAVSANEDVMVFSSDMNGTTGGVHSDLWMSTFDKKTKKWSKPVNMGKQINTNEREGFPYISEDGSLYFSSDGHGGMGGLDIFKAPKTSLTEWKWGTPENMKLPFNSPADDFGIVFDGKLKKGYLTSNREGTKGSDDIWEFHYEPCITLLSGVAMDTVNKIPVSNALVILNYADGTQESQRTGAKGTYSFNIGENETFIVSVKIDSLTQSAKTKKYFSPNEKQNGKFTTVGLIDCHPNTKDFVINPIPDVEVIFPAVLYDLDKATLRPESKDSLDFLYQILIDNPNLVIELDAHTDCRGSADHNRDLAQRRAQACVDYLISKGISKDRLVAKGFGEDRPLKLASGVVLTEKYINSQPAKDREALHQMNRRTTFRVLNTNYVDPKAPSKLPTAPVKVRKGYYDESGDEVSDDGSDSNETPETATPK